MGWTLLVIERSPGSKKAAAQGSARGCREIEGWAGRLQLIPIGRLGSWVRVRLGARPCLWGTIGGVFNERRSTEWQTRCTAGDCHGHGWLVGPGFVGGIL